MTRRKKPFPFFLWHRRLGLVAILLVCILAITGIMLNHTEELGLDKMPVSNRWLLDWYGIKASNPSVSYYADNHWLMQLDNKVYLDGRHVFNTDENINGFVHGQGLFIATSLSRLFLLDDKGDLVDRQSLTDITGPVQKLGTSPQGVIIMNLEGHTFVADRDIINWRAANTSRDHWSRPGVAPDKLMDQVKQQYREHALNMERVVLDLHSGRLIHPRYGVWLMDAAAVVLLFLSFSGLWVWWSRKRKMRRKKHFRKHHRG